MSDKPAPSLWGMVYEGALLPPTRRTERDIWKYVSDLKRMSQYDLKNKSYRAVKVELVPLEDK